MQVMKKKTKAKRNTEIVEPPRKLMNAAVEIAMTPAKQADELGFMARALILATMPHSKPDGIQYVRRNGEFTLTMTAAADGIGLPYGSLPRLILAYLITQAVKRRDRVVELGDSLTAFMDELDLLPTGGRHGSITRLKDQLRRLLNCAVSFRYATDGMEAGKARLIADDYALMWEPKSPDQRSLWASSVTLSEPFYREIIEHAVPLDMRALKALKRSPLALDIYMWLTYRSGAGRPVTVPWPALKSQFGAEYPDTAQGMAHFRAKFKDAMRKVRAVYQGGEVTIETERVSIAPSSRPHIARQSG